MSFLGQLLFMNITEILSIVVNIEWLRGWKDFLEKNAQMFQEAPFFHKDMKVLRIFYVNLITCLVEEGDNR